MYKCIDYIIDGILVNSTDGSMIYKCMIFSFHIQEILHILEIFHIQDKLDILEIFYYLDFSKNF